MATRKVEIVIRELNIKSQDILSSFIHSVKHMSTIIKRYVILE